MPDLDLDTLLQPISDDAPGGEDLEYDPDFIALELASKPTEERVIGDSVIPAEDPDYTAVADQAATLLTRTQDLRIAAILANALLRIRALDGFRLALAYTAGCLEAHWDAVHPRPDADDGDLTMRVNAVLALASREGVLQSLRHAPLVESRSFGSLCLRDLEIASGDASAPASYGKTPDPQTVAATFAEAGGDAAQETLTAAEETLASVDTICTLFDAHVGTAGPDLDPLRDMLRDICRRLGAFTDGEPARDSADSPSPQADIAPPPPRTTGDTITTPQDVTAALDRIMAYYARYEPSSPLPILLTRAKRLVSADFVTIMKDMAPEGVSNIALIGGFEPSEGDEGTY
ncbi:type VI secretion system protein TssA [uncultured Roseobacter sp.]|uniref:type VI secretion system protein TssA n=1 Tax=uncultured Roseobacter sp. TaxID=114847 RepID=UPI00262F4181|nr:type VI secretion system protein TssA [uncultured Roseobacter sp.]